jgi:tetratricopeptide (TPR) repeat protein
MKERTLSTIALAALVCLAAPAHAEEVPISPDARAHFAAGVNLLQDPDGARYEEAYAEFKTAYQISPSWKILGNLGIAAFKLERDGEALAAFEKYLAEGAQEIDAEERAQFERDVTTLRASLVRLNLSSDPPGAVISDERHPKRAAWSGIATRR